MGAGLGMLGAAAIQAGGSAMSDGGSEDARLAKEKTKGLRQERATYEAAGQPADVVKSYANMDRIIADMYGPGSEPVRALMMGIGAINMGMWAGAQVKNWSEGMQPVLTNAYDKAKNSKWGRVTEKLASGKKSGPSLAYQNALQKFRPNKSRPQPQYGQQGAPWTGRD